MIQLKSQKLKIKLLINDTLNREIVNTYKLYKKKFHDVNDTNWNSAVWTVSKILKKYLSDRGFKKE